MAVDLPRKTAVLLAEDDNESRALIKQHLQQLGYRIGEAVDGPGTIHEASLGDYDIVVLDLGLPGAEDEELVTRLQRAMPIPIIIYTGNTDESYRITMLNAGADGYLTKPASPADLEANIRAVLRRGQHAGKTMRLEMGEIRIDRYSHRVEVGEQSLELTPKEFDLLYFMASHPDRVFTRDELLQHVWGSSAEWQDPATVTEHIRRVRSKIEPDDRKPYYVQTVRGVGYRFNGKIVQGA